jgi:hypothetical protein
MIKHNRMKERFRNAFKQGEKIPPGKPLSDMAKASYNGNLFNMRWLIRNGSVVDDDAFLAACKNRKSNAIEVLTWIINKNSKYGDKFRNFKPNKNINLNDYDLEIKTELDSDNELSSYEDLDSHSNEDSDDNYIYNELNFFYRYN